MARRQRAGKSSEDVPLRQPKRGDPTEKTLLDLAQERKLYQQAGRREAELRKVAEHTNAEPRGTEDADNNDATMSPTVTRILDSLLWGSTLAMLHSTLDVLVQHQYAVDLVWRSIVERSAVAFAVFSLLMYVLHSHGKDQVLLPGLPQKWQHGLQQTVFFITAVLAGCYLVYITNTYGYLAVMKRAPPLGCLWVWSVIELDLMWAVPSLALTAFYAWQRGFGFR